MDKLHRPGKIAAQALTQLFKKPATIAYPAGELKIDEHYRGKLVYDATNCIGCNLCVRDCPAKAIKIINIGTKEEKVFELHLNLAHCIFCCQCVDSCPKDCIDMSTDIELASLDKSTLTDINL